METKNEYSRVVFEDDKIVSELTSIWSKKRKKTYNTIKYSDIKELSISTVKPLAYFTYCAGFCVIGYGFMTKEKEVLNTIYRVPATAEEMVVFSILGALIIALGFYYFHIKYGKLKTLSVKHFEGKKKSTPIFSSENEKEIIDLKRELENRIYKK